MSFRETCSIYGFAVTQPSDVQYDDAKFGRRNWTLVFSRFGPQSGSRNRAGSPLGTDSFQTAASFAPDQRRSAYWVRTKHVSSISTPRPLAKAFADPVTVKPHFSSTRMEPRLSWAALA